MAFAMEQYEMSESRAACSTNTSLSKHTCSARCLWLSSHSAIQPVVRLASSLGPLRRFNLAHPKLLIL